MKRGLAAVGVAAVLLLTGCSAATQENGAVSSATGSSDATTESAAPLTAQTPAEDAQGGEAAFLEQVRASLRPDNVIPDATDDQLLAAGERACEVIATTANTNTVSLIDGEPANGLGYYTDSGVIISTARATLCD